MDVNVNAQTIKTPLRPLLHARIILALMYPVLMHSPRPNETSARSESEEEEGTWCYGLALCKVTGIQMRTGRELQERGRQWHPVMGQTGELCSFKTTSWRQRHEKKLHFVSKPSNVPSNSPLLSGGRLASSACRRVRASLCIRLI